MVFSNRFKILPKFSTVGIKMPRRKQDCPKRMKCKLGFMRKINTASVVNMCSLITEGWFLGQVWGKSNRTEVCKILNGFM